ncbi:MAG: dTDP-4-dehydrorhamnose reductase [Alistipes sp.]|jgi:dTDP-4-dehydrorhamnose reductase
MNILVTGANGQLGNELRLVTAESADRYVFTDVGELDITDAEAIERMVAANGIELIINCAAYTNVDKAEDDRALAERLNTTAVEHLAAAMKRRNGWLVHISTDYVFGGDPYNTPCKEDQQGTPTGVYGETKLHGEQAIARIGCHHIIIRTAWLYSEFGKNFVKTMLDLTASKPELKVVFDQTGTPTYARDLAEAIFAIVEGRKYAGNEGIYHYSNEGVCSWYDFTKTIAELAGRTKCDIQPCHSDEFPSKVKRPAYSVLDKTKIKTVFGLRIPYWTDSLKTCLQNLKEYER